MKYLFLIALVFPTLLSSAQSSYKDSINNYIKNYIDTHEVVKDEDRKQMHFFDVNEKYRVIAKFEKAHTNQWFEMPTSGRIKKVFRVYGILSFTMLPPELKLTNRVDTLTCKPTISKTKK
jgi:hypothetical protein